MSHREELHLDSQKRLLAADGRSLLPPQRQPALTVSHSNSYRHRILRAPGEAYPDSASGRARYWLHSRQCGSRRKHSIPPATLLRTYRQELIRGHLSIRTTIFPFSRLTNATTKTRFILSAIAQKALSDGDLSSAIAYATQVIDRVPLRRMTTCMLDSFWRAREIR